MCVLRRFVIFCFVKHPAECNLYLNIKDVNNRKAHKAYIFVDFRNKQNNFPLVIDMRGGFIYRGYESVFFHVKIYVCWYDIREK